jgi:hypothetical protein
LSIIVPSIELRALEQRLGLILASAQARAQTAPDIAEREAGNENREMSKVSPLLN